MTAKQPQHGESGHTAPTEFDAIIIGAGISGSYRLRKLGRQIAGFPKRFTVAGAHNAANFCNVRRCIGQNVERMSDCIAHLRDKGLNQIAATETAGREWQRDCEEVVADTLFPTTNS